jgi:polyhydroxyalkanoate synthesis regulator phasin
MGRHVLIRREIERLQKELADFQNQPKAAALYPAELLGRYIDDIMRKIQECERELADSDDSEYWGG